jgi:hypothetical protein
LKKLPSFGAIMLPLKQAKSRFMIRSIFSHFPPSITALLLQGSAFLLIWLTVPATGLHATPFQLAWLCGLLAAILSYVFRLAKWWLLMQLLFVPTLMWMLSFELPPNLYLIAFLILLLMFWGTFRTQVPLYLSSKQVWHAIELLLPAQKTDSGFAFLDLGSGLGGVLTHLAETRPDGSYVGVESAPFPFLWSWLRIRLGGHRNSHVLWGSLWDCDLSQYDVVFAYLSPVPMKKLWLKAREEMRPGTLFISSTFSVPDQSPNETVLVDDLHRSSLLIWHM